MWGKYQLRYELTADEMLGAADLSRMQEYKPSLLRVGWEGVTPTRKTVNHRFSHSSGLQMKKVG